MGDRVYQSTVRIVRQEGPVRVAQLPGEPQPVVFSVHGEIAAHYGRKPEEIREPHAATLDYIVAATGG
jgi:hypothetical protein